MNSTYMEYFVKPVQNFLNLCQAKKMFDLIRYKPWLDKPRLPSLGTPGQAHTGAGGVNGKGVNQRITQHDGICSSESFDMTVDIVTDKEASADITEQQDAGKVILKYAAAGGR